VPFVRVIRDKRGYETTYLMHWFRDGTRQRSRILYVFRTPGGVRVGRQSLEPTILRDIEAQHPDIEFDWKSVFENQQIIESAPEPRRPRKKRRAEEGTTEAVPTAAGAAVAEPAAPARPQPVPSRIEGATPDEQIAFLQTWYPAIRDRVPRRTRDPVRQEALLALAERLNPAAWTDADQITAGLQQASEALERLGRVFSRRRRRARRSGRPEAARRSESTPDSVVEPPNTVDEPSDA
jgi:hypothetical protein